MKQLIILFTLLTIFSSCSEEKKDMSPKLRHVVMFKYFDTSSDTDITHVSEAFANLDGTIPEVKAFEWGTNTSPENLNQGFTHCYTLTFASEEDRAIYDKHPAHKAFQDILKPHMEKVFVIDYWTK